jgi:hypothetical protein
VMVDVHAGPFAPLILGVCSWRWRWEDVFLDCRDRAIPDTGMCAEHFIEAAHHREDLGISPARSRHEEQT